jgi:hypothetical protein
MNQQRRMFRGRAGATDSQLPKQNARRRKGPNQDNDRVRVNKYAAADAAEQANQVPLAVPDNSENVAHSDNLSSDEKDIMDEDETEEVPSTDSNPSTKEMQHLLRRIRNVRESMQLSSTGLGNISTYENNALHAVSNCIAEWRAILRFYADNVIDNPRTVGLQVFEMIQQSLQCGPLAGGKPGYFKRCGADVAKLVLTFLQDNVADKDDALALHMTEKQADAIEKWKVAAAKAIENDNPASKSVKKKEANANKKKKG